MMITLFSDKWQLENIEAIIFDKDGTIVLQDLYWGEVVKRRVEAVLEFYQLGEMLKEALILALGFDEKINKLVENAPIAIYSRDDVIKFLMNKLPVPTEFENIDKIFAQVHEAINPQDFLEPIGEALELIKNLRELPVKLVLITSDGYKNTLKTLDKLGIMDDFELILGRENCDEPKETGKIMKEALELLGINPQKIIAIGDTKCDSDMAKNSGLKACVLVATGQVPLEELQTHSNFCINSFGDIVTKM